MVLGNKIDVEENKRMVSGLFWLVSGEGVSNRAIDFSKTSHDFLPV